MSERGRKPGREPDRILTEAQCVALAEQIFGLSQGDGETQVRIISHWEGTLRWGRNRVTLASDRQEVELGIHRRVNGMWSGVKTNQLAPAALEAAVRSAERRGRSYGGKGRSPIPYLQDPPKHTYLKPAIWSEATYQLTSEARGRVARELIDPAEAKGMLSAGYLAAEAGAYAVIDSLGEQRLYGAMTQSRCAMTVRDPEGTGSGWAGQTSYDWSKIPASALADRALAKCLASRNPVALEPGRYTVILEPQAVADLLSVLMDAGQLAQDPLGFDRNQGGNGPFSLNDGKNLGGKGFTKLGLKIVDERVTIGQDPLDPELGTLPFTWKWHDEPEDGEPHRAVNWIEKGVLTNLTYGERWARQQLTQPLGLPNSRGWRMAGGETSMEEMIATTKRGVLVTRFVNVTPWNYGSLLSTGFTRDGLWLIENGQIIKPVKNLRFADSPLFVLNSLEQLGPAERVFRPGNRARLQPAVVPPLKARDFNFTALIDAV